jgi:hypothetical protein
MLMVPSLYLFPVGGNPRRHGEGLKAKSRHKYIIAFMTPTLIPFDPPCLYPSCHPLLLLSSTDIIRFLIFLDTFQLPSHNSFRKKKKKNNDSQ